MSRRSAKKILLGVLCCALFALGGCISDGEHYYERKHIEVIDSALVAHSIKDYDALRSTIINMINNRTEFDKLRVAGYDGELDTDLQEIRNEILTQYPVGAYSVSSLDYAREGVLSYQEVSVTVQYRLSQAEMAQIYEVFSADDVDKRMTSMYSVFADKRALYFGSDYDLDINSLQRRMEYNWLNSGILAIGYKGASVTRYPDSDTENAIVEIKNDYLYDKKELRQLSDKIESRAREIASACEGTAQSEQISFIYSYLKENVEYDTEAMRVVIETGGTQPKTHLYTAYGALIEGVAAQSGITLGAAVLCDVLGIDNVVFSGSFNGEPYTWLAVKIDGKIMHFDATSAEIDGEASYIFDTAHARDTFVWDNTIYKINALF